MSENDALVEGMIRRKNEFELLLRVAVASKISSRLKTYRIKLITREIAALKLEIQAATKAASSSSAESS